MSNDVIRVLLVEDNPADAYLLRNFLSTVEYIELTQAEQLKDAIHYLRGTNFDAVLLDLSLPDSRGIETVKKIHTSNPRTPIVVLTGLDDEDVAISALREGAQDYLIKGEIQRTWLVRAINYAIERQLNLDKLQHLNAELTRSNQELEQFAYVVSHDLQQPLQSIFGFAKLLAYTYRDQLDAPVNQYIHQIINASQHMAQLIQDLLTYATVGQSEQLCDPIDCNQVMEKVLAELQQSIHESHADIIIDGLPIICANETQLSQLFQNLLSNALKYQSAEQPPQVQVSAEHQKNEWLFKVHDNGIGIQPEYFDQIFQIFRRLHTKDEYPGTGIGLATCKKIVESHGGRIWVDSKPTLGTTFFFTLPEPQNGICTLRV
ncbi:MAG: ATP-binding protein [Cyanobacteria bacterium P01_F01_bin.13]